MKNELNEKLPSRGRFLKMRAAEKNGVIHRFIFEAPPGEAPDYVSDRELPKKIRAKLGAAGFETDVFHEEGGPYSVLIEDDAAISAVGMARRRIPAWCLAALQVRRQQRRWESLQREKDSEEAAAAVKSPDRRPI